MATSGEFDDYLEAENAGNDIIMNLESSIVYGSC